MHEGPATSGPVIYPSYPEYLEIRYTKALLSIDKTGLDSIDRFGVVVLLEEVQKRKSQSIRRSGIPDPW